MPEPAPIEVHKALADDTRYRLYRYLRLSGRPVSVRELSVRLSLHPNTLRPHLRRLEEAGLVASEVQRGADGGAAADDVHGGRARGARGPRLSAARPRSWPGCLPGSASANGRRSLAREWGAYLVGRSVPRPGARGPSGPNLAVLQEALAEAGLRPAVPPPEREDRRDLVARLPVPRPAGRAPRAGLRGPPGPPRGHARAPRGPRSSSTASSRSPTDPPSAACRPAVPESSLRTLPREHPAYRD